MSSYRDADDGTEGWEDAEADYDGDDTDEEPTIPCPYCRGEILEDTPRCPYCERYISEEDQASPGKPLWMILTALICLGVAIGGIFLAF